MKKNKLLTNIPKNLPKVIHVDFRPQETPEGRHKLMRTARDYIMIENILCMKTGQYQGNTSMIQGMGRQYPKGLYH